jgi:subtilisin-like proprotein convertase family protein
MRVRTLIFRSLRPITVLVALGVLPTAWALEPVEQKVSLQTKQFFKEDLRISTSNAPVGADLIRQRSGDAVLDRFFQDHGSDFHFFMDPRSGSLTALVGRVPLIPGSGSSNTKTLEDVAAALGRPVAAVDSRVVEELIRGFVVRNADLIGLTVSQLGPTRAIRVNDDLWQIGISQQVDGIPVRHGRLVATINHGNLVLLGTETWGNVNLDTHPQITGDQALGIGFVYADGRRPEDKLWKKPTLEIIPYAPAEHQTGDAFTGPVGQGYRHRLVWSFGFRRSPDAYRWEVMVDAHSGELLAFEDTNHYSEEQVVGGIYPLTSTEICPSNETCGTMESGYPMPFADTGQAPPDDFTNSAGLYEYTGGTMTTELSGRYVRVNDNCGAISESTEDGSLDLGGVNGEHDCTSAGTSPGDTPASRSCFYELNKLIEMAQGWLPANTWLQSQLPATVNITDTCNAFYDYSSVNFFKSGGGCRNTGEIAAVFDHEWGHAMDDNDAGGSMSTSSEAYADIASIYRLHASCVGFGFWHTNDRGCGQTSDGTGFNANESRSGVHCDLDCSGVRDADWDKHSDHTPDTPQNFSCVHCSFGSGPCGAQVHCDAAPSRQAAWDFVARDLQGPPFNYDANTAFIVANRLFYQGSGNIGNWHACTCPDSSNGCGATNAYMQWLATDDDNGDLNDGTPHMTALHAAFARHNIACDLPDPVDSGCPLGPDQAPTLSVSVGSHELGLQWSTVPGAVRYRVFRTEGHAGCDFGKTLVAEVVGTTHDDLDVANGREYSYVVQAVGTSPACFGPVSACETATPLPCAGSIRLDRPVYNCSDTLALSLVDSDLVGAGFHQVEVRSTTEAAPEIVMVVETPVGSGNFGGTIVTTDAPPVHGDGLLSVADGGSITASYQDLSYCGTPDVTVEKTVPVDCAAPIISGVQATNVTGSTADITWQTSEVADSGVVYDLTTPPIANGAADAQPVTSHLLQLTGLQECSDYFYFVHSTDPASNTAGDDNGGSYYTFETGRNVNPTYPTTDPPVPIPDSDPAGAESTIVVLDDKVIQDVDVTVNITHTYDGDLVLSLIGPGGASIVLSNRRGGSGNDFLETVFDDEANTPVANGDAPFTGSFRPDEPLSAFDGQSPLGTWRLRVEDMAGADVGSIESWSITFSYPPQSCGPHLGYESHGVADVCTGMIGGGGGNDVVEPGEDIVLPVVLRNDGTGPTTGITVRLGTTTPGVTVTHATGGYPDLMPGETANSLSTPFSMTVGTGVACGTVIDLVLEASCNEGTYSDSFTVLVGTPGIDLSTYDSLDVPQPITDNTTITSNIDVTDTATVTDVDVGLTLTHTYDGDLDIFLIGPDGTRVELSTDNGGSGENFTDTVFDDEAATPITGGSPPYTGAFRPEGSLAALDGISAAGSWVLEITDDAGGDTGELLDWSLTLTTESDPICHNCLVMAPGSVGGLQWMPASTTELAWTPTPGAAFYNVYRGLGSDLELLLDGAVDSCREMTTTESTTGDVLLDVPVSGSMYWYLVRAGTAGGEGPASDSTYGPRVQDSAGACP